MYRWVVVVSVVLYGVACAYPALQFEQYVRGAVKGPEEMTGLNVLVIGWLGPFALQFAWFANPLWLLGLWALATRRWRRAAVFTGLALLLSLQTFQLFWQDVPADEGGVGQLRLRQFGPGFFVWQGALVVAFAGALLGGPTSPGRKDAPAIAEKQEV